MYEKSKVYLDEFAKYVVMQPFPFVVDLKHSHGMWIHTIDGEELFDWCGYYGSRLIGHNHPKMFESDYIEKLIFAANNKMANPDFLTPECVEYYRKIYALAPLCMKNPKLEIYAVNSGAEAIENLLKYFINLYDARMKEKNKPIGVKRMIYFDQAFHGRTIFTLNITNLSHVPIINRNFEHMTVDNIKVPFPAIDNDKTEAENNQVVNDCLQILRKEIESAPDEIVGIIVEPIQGAGGHRSTYPFFFQELSKIAHEFEISLGFDEVQTAGGQTGSFFAVDSYDLPYPPQAIATGKKLANGVVYMLYPMEDKGILDSTWGGNLADMVRFCQEMKVLEEGHLMEHVPQKTTILLDGLNALKDKHPDKIRNVRGMGLYQGFSLVNPQNLAKLVEYAQDEEKLILLEAGTDSIRLRPTMDVTVEEIRLMLDILDRCLAALD
ncbi:aspartate aminotransferase family protein [Parabacteroides sp. Marseille-P3160]|uniref:aspartate aminotransferase family protein n=1 Tax=Parabacteroides sp. Marseille-P3160 TaxID=1917887 RepID=UPI0009BA9A09|nr:aminotransferase class III-fold pyridoxal phosphate-dependent enzyme [Parabacteroides sp. Marseille-P3160]